MLAARRTDTYAVLTEMYKTKSRRETDAYASNSPHTTYLHVIAAQHRWLIPATINAKYPGVACGELSRTLALTGSRLSRRLPPPPAQLLLAAVKPATSSVAVQHPSPSQHAANLNY